MGMLVMIVGKSTIENNKDINIVSTESLLDDYKDVYDLNKKTNIKVFNLDIFNKYLLNISKLNTFIFVFLFKS